MPNLKKTNWFAKHKVISGVLGLIVLGVIVSSLGGNKDTSNSSNNQPIADTSATQPAPTDTPVAPAPVAPTNKQKVAEWFNKYGSVLSVYTPDFNQISKDAGNSDTPAVGKDCQKLSDDVTKAQAVPAIPDAQSASDFSSALTYYQNGASQCVTAANNDDNQGLIDAAKVLGMGNDKIKATSADIKAVQ
jgi:hypothetical protein